MAGTKQGLCGLAAGETLRRAAGLTARSGQEGGAGAVTGPASRRRMGPGASVSAQNGGNKVLSRADGIPHGGSGIPGAACSASHCGGLGTSAGASAGLEAPSTRDTI